MVYYLTSNAQTRGSIRWWLHSLTCWKKAFYSSKMVGLITMCCKQPEYSNLRTKVMPGRFTPGNKKILRSSYEWGEGDSNDVDLEKEIRNRWSSHDIAHFGAVLKATNLFFDTILRQITLFTAAFIAKDLSTCPTVVFSRQYTKCRATPSKKILHSHK